jgi:hypothetical protein
VTETKTQKEVSAGRSSGTVEEENVSGTPTPTSSRTRAPGKRTGKKHEIILKLVPKNLKFSDQNYFNEHITNDFFLAVTESKTQKQVGAGRSSGTDEKESATGTRTSAKRTGKKT